MEEINENVQGVNSKDGDQNDNGGLAAEEKEVSSSSVTSDNEDARKVYKRPYNKNNYNSANNSRAEREGGGFKKFNNNFRRRRRRVCEFCADRVDFIDYKDVAKLSKFITDRAKMMSRRSCGTCSKHQRELSVAIKRARYVALLPFCND